MRRDGYIIVNEILTQEKEFQKSPAKMAAVMGGLSAAENALRWKTAKSRMKMRIKPELWNKYLRSSEYKAGRNKFFAKSLAIAAGTALIAAGLAKLNQQMRAKARAKARAKK